MNLREFFQSWGDRAPEELQDAFPGPFLLINFPDQDDLWERRVVPLQEVDTPLQREVLLGRAAQCALSIREAGVSSRHAVFQRVSLERNGRWAVVDLCSTNGTYMDNKRLPPGQPEILRNDENLIFGTDVAVRFLTFKALGHVIHKLQHVGVAPPLPLGMAEDGNLTMVDTRDPDLVRTQRNSSLKTDTDEETTHLKPLAVRPRPWSPPTQWSDGLQQKSLSSDTSRIQLPASYDYWLISESLPPAKLHPGREVVLGRSQQADITIPNSSISRRHALLSIEKGIVFIEDLGSANGTVVGTYEISKQKIPLDLGKPFWVGPFKFHVVNRGEEVKDHPADDTRMLQQRQAKENIIFSGTISEMPVAEVLQGVEFNGRTGTLFVEAPAFEGRISFESGRPLYAASVNDGVTKLGPAAIYNLLGANEGRFSFLGSVEQSEANVRISIGAALLEFSRLQDERSHI